MLEIRITFYGNIEIARNDYSTKLCLLL